MLALLIERDSKRIRRKLGRVMNDAAPCVLRANQILADVQEKIREIKLLLEREVSREGD